MTLLLKDPGASLDYSVDWGAEYLDADGLAASSWLVEPDEAPGLASTVETGSRSILIPASEIPASAGEAVEVRVARIGPFMPSREATRSLTL